MILLAESPMHEILEAEARAHEAPTAEMSAGAGVAGADAALRRQLQMLQVKAQVAACN